MAVLLGCAVAARAQNIYASLTGTVTDQSGAVVPGAILTATNTDTGFKRAATANERGDFLLLQLPIGKYILTAELQGFRTESRTGIVLQVDQRAREDFKLQVGATTETVQVTASAPLVQSETSSVGQVVNNTQVIELPLNGRNFNQLPLIVIGAQPAPAVGTAGSGFSTGGGRGNTNNYLLDGVDNQEPGVITVGFSPSVEMIQEFKLDQNAYSAELGRYSGGQVNVSTKSGTNRFHGSLFEFLRNTKLDAKNFFDAPNLPTPPLKRNQFGASFGGPIIKDKTFFFFVWESTRLRQGLTGRAAVPTEAFLRGDFSALLVAGNPYTTAGRSVQLVHPITKVPYANNQIPTNTFDPIGTKIAAIYPKPNLTTAGTVNFVSNPVLINDPDQWSIRADHRLTSKDSLMFRFSRNTSFASDPFASPGNQTVIPGYARLTDGERINGVATYMRVLSANVVNELRVGYTKLFNDIRPTDPTTNAAAALGITTLDPAAYLPRYSGTPTVNVAGFGGIGYPAPIPQSRVNNTFQIIDNLSWTKGSHALKFGINLLQFQIYQALNGALRGTFTFNGQFASAGATTGFGISDLLLGYPSAVSRFVFTGPNPRTYQIHNTHDFYAQDDWKVSHKLTLNLGLRYELDQPVYFKGGQMAAFNPLTGTIQIPSGVRPETDPRKYIFPTRIPVPIETYSGSSSRLCKTDKHNLAPRVGFALRPFNDNKTSVHGGYGIFYNIDPFNSTCGSGTMLWVFTQSSPTLAATAAPNLTLQNPFPAAVLAASLPLTYNVPNQHVTPYAQQWNLSIERELKPSLVAEVRYLGSKGTHLPVTLNINQAVQGTGLVNTRRPFAGLGLTGNITGTAYAAASNYHALNLRVEKRMSNGLSFLTGYAWSKAIDTSTGLVPQNSLNLSADRGLATFDMRHRFIASYTWELPFGQGRRFGKDLHAVLDSLAGGWQFSGIFVTNSGTALTPVITVDNSSTGGGADRPNVLRNPNLDNPTPDRWFDTSAFATATAGQFGNAGRGVIAGPGATTLDFALQK